MLFQTICAFFLKLIIHTGKVSSSEQCTQFTIQFYEITDLDKIDQFERGSFGILNNLTKQCGSINVAIEIDLYREEKMSNYYNKLYGDDLYKLTVIYPLDDNVTEEIESPAECPISGTYEPKNFPIDESIPIRNPEYGNENTDNTEPTKHYTDYTIAKDMSESTTHYTDYTTKDMSESTTEPNTTKMNNNSYIGDPDKLTNKKNDNKVMIIVLSSLAGVASVSVISYFAYHGIKTLIQSGTFRFPDA